MNKKNYFAQKVFVVTGASSGIGKAIAIEAAKQGANVSIAARNIEKLNDVAKVIEGFGVGCLAVKTDVSKKEDAKNLIDKTIEKFGKIDVLINNAGISMRAMFDELDLQVFDKVMSINFMGTVYCTRYALPYILKQKGSVVGISSVSGFTPLPGRTAYCSSKYAMYGFLTTLRIENITRGLHVMIAHPGFTESNIRKHALLADGREQGQTPRKEEKMMTAEEVAIRILKGIRKRKRVMIMTLVGKTAWILEKFIPWWAHKQIYKGIAKEPDTPIPAWKKKH
jgi:short-subunit dehydrogenase